MDLVYEIITVLRVMIIPIGVVFRVVFCLVKMIYDEEAVGSYKKKIRNTITFGIIAELIFVISDLIQNYYSIYFAGGGSGGGGGGGW